ncbi:cytochrome c oxidase assembly protein [Streptomyces sp. Ru87]|uniref:cytochrome c oxidase assembly protein n=1 Tax=Streptomyces sp. Ru87 TaxID=2044307 RepID=UPI000BF965B2|nr:cytochrome c oxidase assembly protein [Streptomyces sp. Ru87]PGH52125.1 hypothetical protein CRI70_03200 [Streptomyces sp. Ru87]
MILAHVHSGPDTGAGLAGLVTAAAALLAAVVYGAAASRLRRRGDAWPRRRDASFAAGSGSLAWVAVGSLPGGAFTAHMAQHLIVGMAAPLLFVLARPLTLALRALAPGTARRLLVALAHSRPAGWLVFPPLAALLDIGGLWLLYRSGLFAATQHHAWLHAVVHLHVLAAGLLFTFAVCQVDAVRRRWSLTVRGMTLLAAGAAHAVLAKALYAAGPPGTEVAAADLHTGAQVMYYGGDLVEVGLAVVLAASWYRTTGRVRAVRDRARARRRPWAAGVPAAPDARGGIPAPVGTACAAPARRESLAGQARQPEGVRWRPGR